MAAALALAATSACGDPQYDEYFPTADDLTLSLSSVAVAMHGTTEFELRASNVDANATIVVTAVRVTPSSDAFVAELETEAAIGPGESVDLRIRVTSDGERLERPCPPRLRVLSNTGPQPGEHFIDLSAVPTLSDLEMADALDLGEVEVGEVVSSVVTLRNPADTAAVVWTSSSGSNDFTVVRGFGGPFVIDANGTLELEVSFSPSGEGAQQAVVAIEGCAGERFMDVGGVGMP